MFSLALQFIFSDSCSLNQPGNWHLIWPSGGTHRSPADIINLTQMPFLTLLVHLHLFPPPFIIFSHLKFLPWLKFISKDSKREIDYISDSNVLDILPGLGTVQWSSDQVSSAVPVEDQSLAAGKHSTSKADFSPTKRGEAVVGGEAWAGETLREESWESLGCQLTSWTTEAWITSGWQRGEKKEEEEGRKEAWDI